MKADTGILQHITPLQTPSNLWNPSKAPLQEPLIKALEGPPKPQSLTGWRNPKGTPKSPAQKLRDLDPAPGCRRWTGGRKAGVAGRAYVGLYRALKALGV